MKKILILLVIAILAFLAYRYFSKPLDPAKQIQKAQQSAFGVVRFWLDQAKQDNAQLMAAVCDTSAKGQSNLMLEAIHEAERERGNGYKDYFVRSMGGGGGIKAILSGEDGGIMMSMTIIVREIDDKWWIIQLTKD
jgi:hypothetical protein